MTKIIPKGYPSDSQPLKSSIGNESFLSTLESDDYELDAQITTHQSFDLQKPSELNIKNLSKSLSHEVSTSSKHLQSDICSPENYKEANGVLEENESNILSHQNRTDILSDDGVIKLMLISSQSDAKIKNSSSEETSDSMIINNEATTEIDNDESNSLTLPSTPKMLTFEESSSLAGNEQIQLEIETDNEMTMQFVTSPTVRRNRMSIQLDGFELVNVENKQASYEDLAAYALETLASFKRKRVRFPNGSSKLPQYCFFCTKTIANRKKLREHQFGVHFKNVGEYVCGICQKRFIFRRHLKAHMAVHSDNRNYSCSICNLTCKRRSHLHKHMATHTNEMNYRCDVCHKNFKVQADLKDHCLQDHKDGQSTCNVCKQTLHTPFSVYIHSMRHSGTRDHVCEKCGASFKRKQHLIAHLNVHEEIKERLKCPACQKEFPDRKTVRKHLEQNHPDLASDYRYDYVCAICNKDFAYKVSC